MILLPVLSLDALIVRMKSRPFSNVLSGVSNASDACSVAQC